MKNKVYRFIWVTLCLVALLGIQNSFASVSLQSGNFFISYTDLSFPGGLQPKVERTYNSKSGYRGIFGWGWGSAYETYLSVGPDGSVIMHEFGGGAENRFVPVNFNQTALKRAVAEIAGVAVSAGMIGTGAQKKAYEKKLSENSIFRNAEWEKLVAQGKMKPKTLPEGTQLVSNEFNYQYITKVSGGYKRVSNEGLVETFDQVGKLMTISDRNNNWLKFKYTGAGILTQLEDNLNRRIQFEINSRGLVSKVTDAMTGRKAVYEYNDRDEMTYSKDVDNITYRHDYSSDGRHNMTKIKYDDGKTLIVEYWGKEKKENVKELIDRSGIRTEYVYEEARRDSGFFAVEVNTKDTSGKILSKSRYEYTTAFRPSGQTWLKKMVATVDGQRTETQYDGGSGLPIEIRQGRLLTRFKYDPKGRVLLKDAPTERTELAYHPQYGKITRVATQMKSGRTKKMLSEYQYDQKGNLIFAKNSDGLTARLVYDSAGRIASLIDNKKRVITFKYNEISKPIEIAYPSVGSIRVTYDNSGKVKDVDSSGGRTIALQVSSAFQGLLTILRPAGVSFSL